tara:strand:- start:697 stop:834 length:138 start_codon:yes stop_codon:yes gene_type:complete
MQFLIKYSIKQEDIYYISDALGKPVTQKSFNASMEKARERKGRSS